MLTLSLLSVIACGDSSADDGGDDGSSDTADDTTTETTETGTETAETTTTGEACGDASICAEPIPEGWQGLTTVSDIGCSGDFAEVLRTLDSEFDPGTWSCECECVAEGVTCPSDGALAIWDGDNCEGDPVETVPLGDDTPCTALPELPANAHVAAAPIPVEGDCIAQLSEFSLPPSFGAHAELCGPSSEPAACGDGGQCVPADANVCIWRPGDSPCPEGVYSEQLVAYGGYDLFQECSCDCGQPSCAGTINLEDGSCNEVLEVDGGSCEPLPANASNASFVAGDPADACGPGVVTQVGGATPLDQITVCCMP
ncbi:MAG: hypothetical protein KC457_08755 [Myxococcales bacterium]|nr:hypothetical protein [Myxococcales bacterium]